MTALTMRVLSAGDSHQSPLPWRRMAWVVWRQHRLTVVGLTVFLGAVSAYVVGEGVHLHDAYATVSACRPASSGACQQLASNFSGTYSYGAGITAALLQAIPPLIGAFIGAPLLAREFEVGTYRYTFTQGFGRTRWTVAKLLPLACVVVVLAGAFSAVFSWAYGPMLNIRGYGYSPLQPTFFDLRCVAFAAWALVAFAIGVLAGTLIRRVIPSMVATLVAWSGLSLLAAVVLRPHYRGTLSSANPNIGPPAHLVSQVWGRNGEPVDLSTLNDALAKVGIRAVGPEAFQPTARRDISQRRISIRSTTC